MTSSDGRSGGAIELRRLHDRELIASTLAHPRVYPHVSDDFSPPPSALAELMRGVPDAVVFLGVYRGGDFGGVFMFHPQDNACHEVHVALLPPAWGESALCLRLACQWIFDHTACRRVVASVPACNLLALRLAEHARMERYGLNPASFLKGGVLHDQILLAIGKP